MKIYQPLRKKDSVLPSLLYSFGVFKSVSDCLSWLLNNDYNPDDYDIIGYNDGDIEKFVIVETDDFIF